ncbi:MAG: hypothetical protein OXE99_04815 [Cellvibrionales bacterium]|nr:hypothetical protein [Cellvibrionales bacterium]
MQETIDANYTNTKNNELPDKQTIAAIKQYLYTKKNKCEKEGIGFELSVQDVCTLLQKAGINFSDVGRRKDQYCLGRRTNSTNKAYIIDSSLPYTLETCRFITNSDNVREGKIGLPRTNETKNKISDGMKGNRNRLGHTNTDEHNRRISKGVKTYWSKRNDKNQKSKL